ncbi:MAG: transcription antitermination factor NusB [Alphaproteobacteria bacterium]
MSDPHPPHSAARTDAPDKAQVTPGARTVALDLLQAVLRKGRPLDDTLERSSANTRLEARDRAFARLLAVTTLRRLGQIDALIATFLDRPLKANARDVEDILRLGLCQLLFLDTPAHAAVDTSVRLVAGRGHSFARGLVNAVLRRADREARERVADQDAPRLNTPDWLWQSWCRSYGEVPSRAIAEMHMRTPPLDITLREPESAGIWAERLGGAVLPTGSVRLAGGGAISDMPGYDEGAWWVQDAAASLPAQLLMNAVPANHGGFRIADLCAAPGGKTAQLAAMTGSRNGAEGGAEIHAVDTSPARLRKHDANLHRLGLKSRTTVADVLSWRPAQAFDAILLDAPCTATGTLRRHPDIAQLKTPDDVARLARLQEALLAASAHLVKPGGVLVYCTCSLEAEEGVEQTARFLEKHPAFIRLPVRAAEIGGIEAAVSAEGDLRTLPHHLGELGGMDGFYAARLRRSE